MNGDLTFEHEVRTTLDEGAPMMPPNHLLHTFEFNARRARRYPRWLALIKEPTMRTDSHVAVGSPTVRVAAILVATMLLAVTLAAAGVAGQRLVAAEGSILVDAAGGGDFTTISEAVDSAEDGSEVLVRPGTYAEVVVIEKDITLRGDGQRGEVILEFGEDGPTISSYHGQVPFGLMLLDTEATVSDLTVRGPNVAAAFVFVGGAPTLERVANELEGDFSGAPHTSVGVLNGAGGTIRDSLLDGPVWDVGARPVPEYEGVTGTGRFIAEDNVIDTGFWLEIADGSSFLRNTIAEDGLELSLQGGGSALVAENDLATIELEPSDGFTIRDNVVHTTGDVEAGITLGTGAAIVEGNAITGAQVGIVVSKGGSSTIRGNQLEELGVAIGFLGTAADAVIEGNRFCGNERNLGLPDGSSPALDPSNEVCEEAAAE